MLLTREQRTALKRVYDRQPIYQPLMLHGYYGFNKEVSRGKLITYREFRRTVRPYFGGDCIIVPWCNMWLGIETDGHTHS